MGNMSPLTEASEGSNNGGWKKNLENLMRVLDVCGFKSDGIGGTEEHVGKVTSREACFDLVRSTRPSANGATVTPGGNSWPVMPSLDGTARTATHWETCRFPHASSGCLWVQGDGIGAPKSKSARSQAGRRASTSFAVPDQARMGRP